MQTVSAEEEHAVGSSKRTESTNVDKEKWPPLFFFKICCIKNEKPITNLYST